MLKRTPKHDCAGGLPLFGGAAGAVQSIGCMCNKNGRKRDCVAHGAYDRGAGATAVFSLKCHAYCAVRAQPVIARQQQPAWVGAVAAAAAAFDERRRKLYCHHAAGAAAAETPSCGGGCAGGEKLFGLHRTGGGDCCTTLLVVLR